MAQLNERYLSVLHTPHEVKHALYNACKNSGFTLTKVKGEEHRFKLSAFHSVYGYYDFDLVIQDVDGAESRIIVSREGGRTLLFDPIRLAEKFLEYVESDLNKYTY